MAYIFDPSSIKRIRKGLGLSIGEFAEKLEISRQSVYDMESGGCEKRPNIKTLEKIMKTFNAHPMAFFIDNKNCLK